MNLARILLFLALNGAACSPEAVAPGLQGVVEIESIDVAFEASGPIVSLAVARGQDVKLGEDLAHLDDELEQRVRAARAAEVDALQAELALLRAGTRSEEVQATHARLAAAREIEHLVEVQLGRQQKLVTEGAAAKVTLDGYQQQLSQVKGERRALSQSLLAQQRGARPQQIEALEARLAAAQAALSAEDERLSRYVLHAPRAGEVIDTHFEAGELVGVGAAVVTLGDRKHPFVDVFLPQQDLSGVAVGRKATLRVDALDRGFDGTVEHVWAHTEFTPRYLFSTSERQNLVVRVRIRVDDPEGELPAGVPAFVVWADG